MVEQVFLLVLLVFFFFFFNDTATTEIYTLSLHDALPICPQSDDPAYWDTWTRQRNVDRSEEHTSELQSRQYLVCRLLLEKKKKPTLTRPPVKHKKIQAHISAITITS